MLMVAQFLIFVQSMGELNFRPVLKEVGPLFTGEIYSTMYYGTHCGENILILRHGILTLMVVVKIDEDLLTPHFIKTVSSKDDCTPPKAVKIVGNGDVVLLLGEDGTLWRLINAFESFNEKDECLHLIDDKCFYQWVPFKKHRIGKVLDITAFQDGFAFLEVDKYFKKKLTVLPTINSTHCEDYIFEELNKHADLKYYITNIKFDISRSVFKYVLEPGDEALMICDKTTGRIDLCSSDKKYLINVSHLLLVSVLTFPRQKCLVLCFQTGKLLFFHYDDSNSSKNCSAYLPEKLTTIAKCNCSESCLLWSDSFDLYHTNVRFQFEKECFVSLVHLEVRNNVMCVLSLLELHSGCLAVTINNFYYYLTINKFTAAKELQKTPEQFLTQIYEAGMKVDKLNKDIENGTYYLEMKNLIQMSGVKKGIELKSEECSITLRSNLKNVFRKEFWNVTLMGAFCKKNFVEIKDLESDLCEGMSITFECDMLKKGQVEVTLVGDFGEKMDLLLVQLGVVGEEKKDLEEEELAKNLIELAKLRNPYFK